MIRATTTSRLRDRRRWVFFSAHVGKNFKGFSSLRGETIWLAVSRLPKVLKEYLEGTGPAPDDAMRSRGSLRFKTHRTESAPRLRHWPGSPWHRSAAATITVPTSVTYSRPRSLGPSSFVLSSFRVFPADSPFVQGRISSRALRAILSRFSHRARIHEVRMANTSLCFQDGEMIYRPSTVEY